MSKQFVFGGGVYCGIVLMQIGHFLYLRNADYLFAVGVTTAIGAMAAAVIVGIWDTDTDD